VRRYFPRSAPLPDGHFHEKESLRLRVRRLAQQRGLLLAFIALDNPAQSLLDMQSVSFSGGKCVMH
jgi:midasin